MLSLLATSFLCGVLFASAARADRHDAMVQVPPERFEKSVAHAEQIKAAVDHVQEKTKVAREAAIAVKDRFGEYQGTLRDLQGQLQSVDEATHAFEGELFKHLVGEEPARLQPFEEYSSEFDHVGISQSRHASAKHTNTAPSHPKGSKESVNATKLHESESEASFLENTIVTSRDLQFPSSPRASSMMQLGGQTISELMSITQNDTGAPIRFKESAAHAEEIKVALGKVKDKVEVAKQAAAKVQQNFGEYRSKITELKTQLDEVDNQQHDYNGKLLDHFEGEEEGRMKIFSEIKPNILGPAADVPNATSGTQNGTALLQAQTRAMIAQA